MKCTSQQSETCVAIGAICLSGSAAGSVWRLDGLELTASFGDYLFVHAGVRPGVPTEKQNPQDLLWIRDEFLRSEEDFGKVVVARVDAARAGAHGVEILRQCQTNANQTAKCAKRIASGCKLTPLGQGGGALLLEDVASAEVAIVVKVIVDRGVDGGEFLQGLDVPEFRHCPFPSSERLV